MNRNVKIAKELVKLAKMLVAGGDASLNREIKQGLSKVKDEEVRQEIENMMNASVKTAFDWKEKVKKVVEWVKNHALDIGFAALLLTSILGPTGVLDKIVGYNGGGFDLSDALAYTAKGLGALGISGALLVKTLEKICEHCGIKKDESEGLIKSMF